MSWARIGVTILALIGLEGRSCPRSHSEDPEALRAQARQAEREAKTDESQSAIIELFEHYRDALTARDGHRAAAAVSEASIELYARYRDQAITLDAAGIDALSLVDRVTVLRMRLELRGTLNRLDGRSLFVETIRRGWTGDVHDLRLQEIEVEGQRAVAVAAGATGKEPVFFVRDGGGWHIDLARYRDEAAQPAFRALYEQQGGTLSETEWALGLAAAVSGVRAEPSILEPLSEAQPESPDG